LAGRDLSERLRQAGREVLFQDEHIDSLGRLRDGHRLLHDVDAVLVLFDHPLDSFEMAGDRTQTGDDVVTCSVAHVRILPRGGGGRGGTIASCLLRNRSRPGCGRKTSTTSWASRIWSAMPERCASAWTRDSFPR